jgi:1-acyl-sn-glycerol-3-phosphate acyltransferase
LESLRNGLLAKEALFTGLARFTIGPILKYLGGISVNRATASGVINNTLKHMQANHYFWLALSPEGTRSYSSYWRSGFYRVVLTAQCPLGLAYFDFKKKIISINEFIVLTGDVTIDLTTIKTYYDGKAHGYLPQKASPIVFKSSL